ncbi:hypothetical protein ABB37_08973 [Leptomonas pyrrhocoris]|uniref:Uncharacterized protein n=1 Tax=Leptomonas pyrrhocoris TaxID=157538 RepID=A0A0M9FRX2_LEPPY|nr:hypothetical protein ABB37_08973 [Leptomonas pyrrhocoris]KPA74626.1 hypothetical protein ABB37_08973 [Leptomonas pyrrhocoris]|eukprot:XP_015653065.1 hypothetical protein ABB37_08973 [Leptomonas pyrrhocoris]
MWRREASAFARTTPAQLDTQYSIEEPASSSPLPPHGDVVGNRWFYVPGSRHRAARIPPEGLVSSSLRNSSSVSSSTDFCTSAILAPQRALLQGTWRDGESTKEGLHQQEVYKQREQHGVLSGELGPKDSPTSSSAEVSRLLRQYRDENNRLREQLKAKELHETHLISKVEELSRRHALLQLECQRALRDPTVMDMFAEAEENSPAWAAATAGAPPQKVRAQLAQKEEEVQQLQMTVRELEGRVEGYRLALQRARAYRSASDSAEQPENHEATLRRSNSSYSSGAPASLHALLLESLSTADFIVKVFNALQHCQHTRHGGDGSCAADSSSSCPHARQACTLRCLRAAVKGAALSPDLRELAGGPENNTTAANVEVALAVREELAYCETVAVRLAAALLSQETGEVEPAAAEDAAVVAVGAASSSPDTNADATEEEREESLTTEEKRPEAPLKTERGTSSAFSAAPAKSLRTKASRCRPDMEDCEVQ